MIIGIFARPTISAEPLSVSATSRSAKRVPVAFSMASAISAMFTADRNRMTPPPELAMATMSFTRSLSRSNVSRNATRRDARLARRARSNAVMFAAMKRTTPLFIIAVTLFAAALRAQSVRYTLRFPSAQTNYVEVEASYPAAGTQQIEVMMPVWSPGSYLVREYSRNVENVSATTVRGESLPVEKARKNRWRFTTRGASQVTFRYRVYGREM